MKSIDRLFRQGSVYTLGTAVQLLGGLLVLPVLTRVLDQTEFGAAVLSQAIGTVAAILIGAGLAPAIMRRYFDGGIEGVGSAASRLVASSIVIACAGTTVLLVLVAACSSFLGFERPSALWLGVVLAFPLAIIASSSALLRVQERPWAFVVVVLAQSLGGQIFGVGAVLAFGATASAYLSGYLAGGVLGACLAVACSGAARARPATTATLRRALAIGGPTIPVAFAMIFIALGDRFVIQGLSGPVDVARYQVAYLIGALGITLLSALQSAWLPITFATSAAGRWSILAYNTTAVVRLAMVLVAVISMLAPFGLQVLAPASYAHADLLAVTVVVALAALPWAIYLPLAQVLLWEERTRPMLVIGPAAAITNLVLAALLFPGYGLQGVAVATFLALSFQAFLCAWAVKRIVSIPWDFAGLAISAAGAMGFAGLALAIPDDGVAAAFLRILIVACAIWLGVRAIGQARDRERTTPHSPFIENTL
ncbi:MAG: lipopolysaccharide biosynthesis protein [Solirubrobacteraceae bacterium]